MSQRRVTPRRTAEGPGYPAGKIGPLDTQAQRKRLRAPPPPSAPPPVPRRPGAPARPEYPTKIAVIRHAADMDHQRVAASLHRPAEARRAWVSNGTNSPARYPGPGLAAAEARFHGGTTRPGRVLYRSGSLSGEVAERLNAPVSKTGIPATVSGVRIPPSPLKVPALRTAARGVSASGRPGPRTRPAPNDRAAPGRRAALSRGASAGRQTSARPRSPVHMSVCSRELKVTLSHGDRR